MKIIPVIDLKAGQVVHAVKGKRDEYQPVQSRLCPGSEASDFIKIFLNEFELDTVYIADLDAISDQGDHLELIQTLLEQFPTLNLLLDVGMSYMAHSLFQSKRLTPVLGTENQFDINTLSNWQKKLNKVMLSLDFNMDGFWGIPEIINNPESWPDEIILMNLDRVGSKRGLELDRLQNIKETSKNKNIYFAGGIRDYDDLLKLKTLGVEGVLLATAIHNGRITSQQLKKL